MKLEHISTTGPCHWNCTFQKLRFLYTLKYGTEMEMLHKYERNILCVSNIKGKLLRKIGNKSGYKGGNVKALVHYISPQCVLSVFEVDNLHSLEVMAQKIQNRKLTKGLNNSNNYR